ncbi:MAG: isoprenylcysteine carboxylmethyltransferase family protein [Acidobacteria bacterium]|nr:isoprenylcysteine carboxylmethyltransferase family protein [Acidobacteriota bacterium]
MRLKRLTRWIATAFSTLIMIEVLIMISPFAFYWYSFYSPTLQVLRRSSWTAWTESFFLPHAVISDSSLLELLRWKVGPYLFSLGLFAFLALAIQLYSAKLRKKGVVRGGIYRYLRHPQYLCLAVAGLGLLTYWPRMIILVFYLAMLIAYYLLARSEEGRMLRAHPNYADYMQRTWMFLPGSPGKHLRRWLFGWVKNPALGTALCCVTGFAVGLGIGFTLRQYTINHVVQAAIPQERILAIAGWPEDARRVEIGSLAQRVLSDPEVNRQIQNEGNSAFSVHLLPDDYGMVNMFGNVGPRTMTPEFTADRFRFVTRYLFPFLGGDRRYRPMGRPQQGKLKLVLSRVDKPDRDWIPLDQVLDASAKMTPIAMVDVDVATGEIIERSDPGRRSVWGPITMPIF